jgi:SAM-dependent methyltransferase
MAAAAREADPPTRVLVAPASELPLADGEADLVVSSMSLLNIGELDRALAEVARVLAPEGRLVFATAHPFSTVRSAYFEEARFSERRDRAGLTMTFTDLHRPLHAITSAVVRVGLLIEALDEPVPSDAYVAEHPEVERWRERPVLLTGRAVKPA